MPDRGSRSLITERLYWEKISRRKNEINNYRASNRTPISDISLWETDEFLLPGEVESKPYRAFNVGESWGGGTNGWFKIKFTIPHSFKGRKAAAYFDVGGEACAFLDGKPFQGVDGNHQEMVLTTRAKGGENYEILIESTSHNWGNPDDRSPKKFERAELVTLNSEVEEYWFNLEVFHLLCERLEEGSARREKIVYHLNKSVDAFDYTHKGDESLKQSARRANALLKPLLDKPAVPSATNVAVHGHSHIDVAWLWPYRETKRKCSRTFSTVMRMIEQYPEYIFTQSQAQLYEFTKQRYPALYEEIKAAVKKGNWDVEGSMWVEADCNLSGGESLIRQIVVGKNYFMREFGKETQVLWLPDVFGYAAALPQILQKARIPYFSTIKINWSQFNTFPYNTFWWEGIDGTRVLAHFPPTTDYNAYPEPTKLLQQEKEFKEKDRSDWSLLSYGWGDGGGGADKRHLEFLRRYKDLEGLPKCRQTKVGEFFNKIDDLEIDYPVWVGELYLELHRGTYTTQARNKWYNRKGEFLYRDAEYFATIASNMEGNYPYDELHGGWQGLLLNQFHDVIPGSSIRSVYEDTDNMYPRIFGIGEKAKNDAISVIVRNIELPTETQEAIVVFNTLSWERSDLVKLSDNGEGDVAISTLDDIEIPVQKRGDGLIFRATAPSMGYATYKMGRRVSKAAPTKLKVSKNLLENEYVRVRLDLQGVISSVFHKQSGRELLKSGERGNMLRLYEDKPIDWQAWDIDFFYEDKWEDVTQVEAIEVVENGQVSVAVKVIRAFNASKLHQTIRLVAGSPMVEFETWVDWHEDNKCLKACFPVDVNASKARYEIQFGNVERPTHSNTSWDKAQFEVCAHKWATIGEADFGMSLFNDCKYGHHTTGSEMRLTLLRSPKDPDPMADMGEHVFSYAIMPHTGDYIQADTVRKAYSFNVPMTAKVVSGSGGDLPAEQSFICVDAENIIIEAVKKAENDDTTIIRLYECHNKRAKATITVKLPFEKVYETDLLEDNIEDVEHLNGQFTVEFNPFEIKTFRLA